MKKISEKILYKGQWLSLKQSVFTTIENQKISWESIERKNNAISFAIIATLRPSNRYILIKQFRHAINNYLIGLPAGITEANIVSEKVIEQCILKELKEETGYTGELKSKSPMLKVNPAILNNNFFISSVEIDETNSKNTNPKQTLEPSEEIETILIEQEKIKDFLIGQSKQGIDIGVGLWFLLYQLN